MREREREASSST